LCIAAISLLTMLATGVVAAREAGGAAQSGSLATTQVFHERQLDSPASERGAVRGLSAAWRPARRRETALEEAAQVWAAEGAAFYVVLDDARPVPGEALPQVTAA
jgi:hypothetical protein